MHISMHTCWLHVGRYTINIYIYPLAVFGFIQNNWSIQFPDRQNHLEISPLGSSTCHPNFFQLKMGIQLTSHKCEPPNIKGVLRMCNYCEIFRDVFFGSVCFDVPFFKNRWWITNNHLSNYLQLWPFTVINRVETPVAQVMYHPKPATTVES